jgi:hypothetical protein
MLSREFLKCRRLHLSFWTKRGLWAAVVASVCIVESSEEKSERRFSVGVRQRCSSPHVGLFVAISMINFCGSAGTRGRPRGFRLFWKWKSRLGAMPTNQCIGFDYCKGVTPVEKTGELSKGKANGVGSAPRLYVSLNVEAKLFSQEQISRRQEQPATGSTKQGTSRRQRKSRCWLEQRLIRQESSVRMTASKYSIDVQKVCFRARR